MAVFSKKKAPVDPLASAAAVQSRALDVFNRAASDLKDANDQFEAVKATEQARIAQAQARHDEASKGQAKNRRVIAKLDDLLGTE